MECGYSRTEMSSSTDRLSRMEKLLEYLADENADTPIIVEGKNDKLALRQLGIGGVVYVVNGRHTLFQMCEEISREQRKVILLTDWDRKGGQICHTLSKGFAANGVSVDEKIRSRLSSLSSGDIKDVEGLPRLVERLRTKAKR